MVDQDNWPQVTRGPQFGIKEGVLSGRLRYLLPNEAPAAESAGVLVVSISPPDGFQVPDDSPIWEDRDQLAHIMPRIGRYIQPSSSHFEVENGNGMGVELVPYELLGVGRATRAQFPHMYLIMETNGTVSLYWELPPLTEVERRHIGVPNARGMVHGVYGLVVCPRNDFTLAASGRRLAETPDFTGDCGRECRSAAKVELQTCSSDTPLAVADLMFMTRLVERSYNPAVCPQHWQIVLGFSGVEQFVLVLAKAQDQLMPNDMNVSRLQVRGTFDVGTLHINWGADAETVKRRVDEDAVWDIHIVRPLFYAVAQAFGLEADSQYSSVRGEKWAHEEELRQRRRMMEEESRRRG